MKGDRALSLAFVRGASFDELDDETGMRAGHSEKRVRAYLLMLNEKPRTHYRHRGKSAAKWLCTPGLYSKRTYNKDRVTCRRCLAYVDKLGGPVLGQ